MTTLASHREKQLLECMMLPQQTPEAVLIVQLYKVRVSLQSSPEATVLLFGDDLNLTTQGCEVTPFGLCH